MRVAALGLVLVSALLAAGDMVTIPAGSFIMGRTNMTSDDKTAMRPKILLDDTPAYRKLIDRYIVSRQLTTPFQ